MCIFSIISCLVLNYMDYESDKREGILEIKKISSDKIKLSDVK